MDRYISFFPTWMFLFVVEQRETRNPKKLNPAFPLTVLTVDGIWSVIFMTTGCLGGKDPIQLHPGNLKSWRFGSDDVPDCNFR